MASKQTIVSDKQIVDYWIHVKNPSRVQNHGLAWNFEVDEESVKRITRVDIVFNGNAVESLIPATCPFNFAFKLPVFDGQTNLRLHMIGSGPAPELKFMFESIDLDDFVNRDIGLHQKIIVKNDCSDGMNAYFHIFYGGKQKRMALFPLFEY